ncbi:MAG: hypothetical protein EG826_10830 [Deltaproteobacteria bacterium]|nr:hypothetical protein [Deltaproteobacteria bacterium]
MAHIIKFSLIVLSLLVSFYPGQFVLAADHSGMAKSGKEKADAQKPVFAPMPAPGKKVPIGSGYTLVYGFDKKPKLGTVIMKVEIFDAAGKKDTSFQVKADSGMPSMSGAHETGDRAFTLSKKGDYLLPISIVMPGDWEIRLTVIKDGKPIFMGRYNFDV